MRVRKWWLGLLFALSGAAITMAGDILEYSAYPDSTNNFAEASFSCLLPVTKPQAVLFLAGGTDSDARPWLADSRWLALAREQRLALIATCLRGAGEAYEFAADGSGQALLDAMESFAKQSGDPTLSRLPLILYGHSAGSQFAFNFACWKPDRVRAIVCLKSGPLQAPFFAETPSFDALFIVGERDLQARVREVAKAYAAGRAMGARWCLALQPGAGHGSEGCRELANSFIAAVNSPSALTHAYAPLHTTNDSEAPELAKIDVNYSWLPNDSFARSWRTFAKPTLLQPLLDLREEQKQETASWRAVTALPEKLQNSAGIVRFEYAIRIPGDCQPVTQAKTQASHPAISVSIKRFSETEWRVSGEFDSHRLPLGAFKSDLNAQFTTETGKNVEGTHALFTRVVGPVSISPPSIYYGVIPRQQTVTYTVEIRADGPQQIRSCKALSSDPDFVSVSISPIAKGSRYQATMTVKTGLRVGARPGSVTFRVETDRTYVLAVPYYGFVNK